VPRRQLDGGVPPAADRRGGARSVHSSVVPSSFVLLSGPGVDRPDGVCRRSRQRGRRCRRGRHCQDAAVASVTGVRHAVSTIRFVVRDRAVQPSGVRPVRCPALCCPPVRCPAVCCPPPVGPIASVSSYLRRWRWGPGRGDRQPSPQQLVEDPVAATPSGGWVAGREARGGRAAPPSSRVGQQGVGGGPSPGLWAGGGRACPLRDQAGQAGVRSARGWRRRCGRGSRLRRELAAPAAWLPPAGWWATTVSGGRGGGPSGRPPARVPAGMGGCGPSAAQAGSGRSRLATGSAVTWGDR
jgi:hypothetical protein